MRNINSVNTNRDLFKIRLISRSKVRIQISLLRLVLPISRPNIAWPDVEVGRHNGGRPSQGNAAIFVGQLEDLLQDLPYREFILPAS